MNWRSPLWRIWSKTIAILVMVSFVFPYLAFAFEATTYPAHPARLSNLNLVKANGAEVKVSPDLGRVVSQYQGKSNKVIIYVHDLHCNYEVQSNIAALLGTLSKENGIQLIGIEGESGTVSVEKLAKFPLDSVKTNVGQYFLKRGRITGAEYLAATGQKNLLLEGIENQALYDQNKETLMKFLKEETQGHCDDLKNIMEKLKIPLYSTQLAKLDHFREQYDSELITLETYCNFLLEQAKQQGMTLSGFPVLNLYAATHKLPVSTDSDYDKLLSDASDLDRGIRERMYTSPDQRLLDHYLFLLKIISNMLTISATAKDLEYYRAHKAEFSVTKLVGFLDNLCYRNAVSSDLDPGVVKLDEYLLLAANFYDVADKRSDAFVQNIMAQMDKHKQSAAVLITGGFHHFGVESAFKKHSISFITVKPRITRTYDENPYFSLLRNKRAPVEELLAQKETLFAPKSAFNDMVFLKYMTSVLNIELLRELMEKSHDSQDFQAAYLDALKQYTPGTNDAMFDFDQMQSNLKKKIYAFPVKGAAYSVVLRPSKVAGDTSAYQAFIKAKEELGNGYEFEIVETTTLQANRGKILGIEDAAPTRVGVVATLQAGLKSVTDVGSRIQAFFTNLHPGYLAGAVVGILAAFAAAPFLALPVAAFSVTQLALVGALLLTGFFFLTNAKSPEWAKAFTGMTLGLLGATIFQQLGPWVMNAAVSTASASQAASLAPAVNSSWLGMLGGLFLPVLGAVSTVGNAEKGRGAAVMPEDDLIARAIAFSQQTVGFGRAEFEGTTYRTSVETMLGRLKDLTVSEQADVAKVRFILEQGLRDPQLLALFSVIWHQTPLTTLNAEGLTDPDQAKSPEEKVLEFARDLAQGEQLAKYLSQGRTIPKALLDGGNSYLAQLVRATSAAPAGTKIKTFALGTDVDSLHPERLLALSLFKNQTSAMRTLAEAQGVALSVEGPVFSSVLGFHPEDAQVLETYKKVVDLARALNVESITIQETLSEDAQKALRAHAEAQKALQTKTVALKLSTLVATDAPDAPVVSPAGAATDTPGMQTPEFGSASERANVDVERRAPRWGMALRARLGRWLKLPAILYLSLSLLGVGTMMFSEGCSREYDIQTDVQDQIKQDAINKMIQSMQTNFMGLQSVMTPEQKVLVQGILDVVRKNPPVYDPRFDYPHASHSGYIGLPEASFATEESLRAAIVHEALHVYYGEQGLNFSEEQRVDVINNAQDAWQWLSPGEEGWVLQKTALVDDQFFGMYRLGPNGEILKREVNPPAPAVTGAPIFGIDGQMLSVQQIIDRVKNSELVMEKRLFTLQVLPLMAMDKFALIYPDFRITPEDRTLAGNALSDLKQWYLAQTEQLFSVLQSMNPAFIGSPEQIKQAFDAYHASPATITKEQKLIIEWYSSTRLTTSADNAMKLMKVNAAPQGAKGAVVDLANIEAKSKPLAEASAGIRSKLAKVLGATGIAVQADGKGAVNTQVLLDKVNAALARVENEKTALEKKARPTPADLDTLQQHGEAVKQLQLLQQQLGVPGVRSLNLRISEGMDPQLHGLAVVDGETIYLNANQIDKFSDNDRTKLTKLVMHEISHVVATGSERQGEIGAYILGRLAAGFQMGIQDVVREIAKVDVGNKATTVEDLSGSGLKLAAAGTQAKGLAFTPEEYAQIKKHFQERSIISVRQDGTRETGKADFDGKKINLYINMFSPDAIAQIMKAQGVSKVQAVMAFGDVVYQHEAFHRRVATGDRQSKFFNNPELFKLFQQLRNSSDEQFQGLTGVVENVVANLYGYPRSVTDEKGVPVLFEEALANYIESAGAIKLGYMGSFDREKVFVLGMNQLLATLRARSKDPQLNALIDKVVQMAGTQADYQKPVQISLADLDAYATAYKNQNMNVLNGFAQTATGRVLNAYFAEGAVVAKGTKAQASKVIAAVRTESYAEVEPRAARDLQPATAYQQALRKNMEGIRSALQHSITDPRMHTRVEAALLELAAGKTNIAVRTVAGIEGGIAVQQLVPGTLNVIMEAQMPAALRDSTFVHEAVEAVMEQEGVPRAHAIAFVVEQAVFPESIDLKLQDITQNHYDATHLQALVQGLDAERDAIDQQTDVNQFVKAQQKANAQKVADAASRILAGAGKTQNAQMAYTTRDGNTLQVPVIAYTELPVGKRLNHGSYSNVYTAEFKGKQVAFLARKVLDPSAGSEYKLPTMDAQEIKDFEEVILDTYANYQTYTGLSYQNHSIAPEIYAVVTNEQGQVIGYLSELLAGKELSELTVVGAITPAQVENALTQLKEQLEILHAKGLRHGDVRGENTMVDVKADGSVVARYIDFWESNKNWSAAQDFELYERMAGVSRWEVEPENVAKTLAQRKSKAEAERNQKFLNEHRAGIEILNNAFYKFKDALQDERLEAAVSQLNQMRRVMRIGTKETRLWTLDDFKELQGALASALPEFLTQLSALLGTQAPTEVQETQKVYIDQLNKLNQEWSAFFGVSQVQTIAPAIAAQPGKNTGATQDANQAATEVTAELARDAEAVANMSLAPEDKDQRGFYGNKTEAALTGILQAFFATHEDVRVQVAAQAAENGILIGVGAQLSREAVRFILNNLTAYQMKAFQNFFSKQGSVKTVRDSQNYLIRGFKNLRTSLRGTMYETQATQARKILDRMRAGEAVPVTVQGQVRTISGIEIRRLNAKDTSQLSPEVAKHVAAVGAFFTLEGGIGVINVMNNVDVEEAAIHEFIEAVAGEDHETVTKMQEFAKYSLGTMSLTRSFWRQFAWPTRVVAAAGAMLGMVTVGVTVGVSIGLGVLSAGLVVAMAAGVFSLVWGVVNFARNKFVITIDGPDASGKKEIAQVLSRYYRYPYVEAGTYYRTFAQILKDAGWNREKLLELSQDLDNPRNREIFEKVIIGKLQGIDLDMSFDRRAVERSMRVYARGKDLGGRKELTDVVMPSTEMDAAQRTAYLETEAMASVLGKFGGIEELVNAQILKLARQRNIIVVGQTMGSTLFRKTGQLKFYVTNDDYRARAEKFHQRHFFSDAEIKAAAQDIQSRDASDSGRARNPLKPVAGAVVLNTGDFDLFEIIDKAKDSINIRSNIFVRIYQAARDWSQPLRVLSRAEGEVARMEALEKGADLWQGLGDVDNLSLNNHFYGKAMADFIIRDVLDSMIRTVKSTEVRRVLFYYRVQKVRELARALLNASEWKMLPKLFMQLRDNQIKVIRQGGDEIITLMPGHLPENAVTDILNMIRSEVSLNMTDAMSFDVRNLQPAQLQALQAALDRINKDFGDKKLVRLAVDAFGPHIYVNVGRNDLTEKFVKEMSSTGTTLSEDQKTGRLVVSVIQKRLREAKLDSATLELLDMAKITSPEEQKATDKEGLQYLKDGRNLRVTMTIGAILGSAVVQEKFRQKMDTASDEEARTLLDTWAKAPQSSGKIKIEEDVDPRTNLAGVFQDVIKTQRLGVAIPLIQESTAELSNVIVEASGAIIHGLKQSIGKNNVEVRSVATHIVPAKDKNFNHSLIGETVQKELASRTAEYNKLRRDENGYARETDENGNMLFDALVPWQYSAYGLEFFAREHIKNANKYNRMVPKVMVGRAPPSAGPDKINLLVFAKDKTHLIEVEGQYFGPFVSQVTENIAAALAKERGLAVEEAKRNAEFMAEVNEKVGALVVGQLEDENLPLLKFKAINDYISYGAGDEMIAMPHLYVKDVMDVLQQGRLEEALPRFLDRLEAKINNPQNQNTAKVRLAAVYSTVPTSVVMEKGIEQLQQEVQIAGMARKPQDGRMVPFQNKHVDIAREVLLGKARSKLLELFKNPSAHAKVEAEIRARLASARASRSVKVRTWLGVSKPVTEGTLVPAVSATPEETARLMRFGRTYNNPQEQFAALQAFYAADPAHVAKPIRLEYDGQGRLNGYRVDAFDGMTLLQYMAETGKPVPADLKNEIRETVNRLHAAGLVHGDLTANHIMISGDAKSFQLINPIGFKPGLQEFGEFSELVLPEAQKADLKNLEFTFSFQPEDLAVQTALENALIRKLPADMPTTPWGRFLQMWTASGQKGLSVAESLQANPESVTLLPWVARITARLGAPLQRGIAVGIWSGLVSFISSGALVWQAVSMSVGNVLRQVVVKDTLRLLGQAPTVQMQEFMQVARTVGQAANVKLTPEELLDEVTLVKEGQRVIDKTALDAKSQALDVQSDQGKALYAILQSAGLEVRGAGTFGLNAEQIRKAITQAQTRLGEEQKQIESRRDALARLESQSANVADLNAALAVNQDAQKLLQTLSASIGARLSQTYAIQLSTALTRQSGLAFRDAQSGDATVYVSQKQIQKALAKNDRTQLVRLFMHEGGHMLGLPGTAEGEALASVLSRILAGYQMSGADIMKEVSKIEKGNRLLLGDGPWAAQGGNVKDRYKDAQLFFDFLTASPEKKQAMRAEATQGPRLEGFIKTMTTLAAMNRDFSMGTDAEIADSDRFSPAEARKVMAGIAEMYRARGNKVEYKTVDPWRGYPEYYKVVEGPDAGAELYIDGVRNITLDQFASEGNATIEGNIEGISRLLPVNAGAANVGGWISGLAQYMNTVIKTTGNTVGPHFHIGAAKPIQNAAKMRLAWTEIEGYVLPMVASILNDVTPAIPLLHERSNPASFAANEEAMGFFGRFITFGRGMDDTEAEHEKFFNVMVKSDGHMEFRMRYPVTDPEVMMKLFILFSAVYNYMENRSQENGLARRWEPMPFAAYYAQGVNRNQNLNDLGEVLSVLNLIVSKRTGDAKPFFDKQQITEFYAKQFLPTVDRVAARPEAMSQFSLDPSILNSGVTYADIKDYMKGLASDIGMDPEFAAQGAARTAEGAVDVVSVQRTARSLSEAQPSVQASIGKVLKMVGMELNAEGRAIFQADGLSAHVQRAITTLDQEKAAIEKKAIKQQTDQDALQKYGEARAILESMAVTLRQQGTKAFDIYLSQSMDPKLHGLAVVDGDKLYLNTWQVNKLAEGNNLAKLVKLLMHEVGHIGGLEGTAAGETQAAVLAKLASGSTLTIADVTREVAKTQNRLVMNAAETGASLALAAIGADQVLAYSPAKRLAPLFVAADLNTFLGSVRSRLGEMGASLKQSLPVQFMQKVLSLPSGAAFMFRQLGQTGSLQGASALMVGLTLVVWAGVTALAVQTGITLILPVVVVGMATLLPTRYLTVRFRTAAHSSAVREALESPGIQTALERLSSDAQINPLVITSLERELLKTLERVADDPQAADEVLQALAALSDMPGVTSRTVHIQLGDRIHTYAVPEEVLTRPSLLNRLMILPVLDQDQRPVEKRQNSLTLDSAA